MGCCRSKTDDTMVNELNTCAQHGYIGPLIELIEKHKEDINVQDKHMCTPLFWAIMFDKPDVVQALINKGADICLKDEDGKTPFMKACSMRLSDKPCSKQILEKILEKGKLIGRLPNVMNSRDKDGNTALLNSITSHVHNDVTEWLIDIGADLNVKDEFGNTALLRAITLKNIETAKRLVSKGAELYHKDELGYTALTKAIAHIDSVDTSLTENILSCLSDLSLIDEQTVIGECALSLALDRGQDRIALDLMRRGRLNRTDSQGRTALMHAILGKCVRKVEICRGLVDSSQLDNLDAADKVSLSVFLN